jgi:ABC-type phosphate transport system auxiliary subunit
MDYNKINKINIDGNGNIVLQDVNGGDITVNYNDTTEIQKLLDKITDKQTFEIKKLIGKQNKTILDEIRKIQEKIDNQNINEKIDEVNQNLDDFFKELSAIKIDAMKKRIITNYKLLRDYEELLIFEEDPKRKMKYENDIEGIKNKISTEETELKTLGSK